MVCIWCGVVLTCVSMPPPLPTYRYTMCCDDVCGYAHVYHSLLHSPHTDTQCAVMMCVDMPLTLSLTSHAHAHAHGSLTYEHIHRQNCLGEYGVKVAVQKLEKIDNSRLQDM